MIIQCGSAKNIENPAISDNYSCGRREGAGEYAESPKIRGFYKKTSDNQNYQKQNCTDFDFLCFFSTVLKVISAVLSVGLVFFRKFFQKNYTE